MLSLRCPKRQCKMPRARAAQGWLWQESFKPKLKRCKGGYSFLLCSFLSFLRDTWNPCSHHATQEGRLCGKTQDRGETREAPRSLKMSVRASPPSLKPATPPTIVTAEDNLLTALGVTVVRILSYLQPKSSQLTKETHDNRSEWSCREAAQGAVCHYLFQVTEKLPDYMCHMCF